MSHDETDRLIRHMTATAMRSALDTAIMQSLDAGVLSIASDRMAELGWGPVRALAFVAKGECSRDAVLVAMPGGSADMLQKHGYKGFEAHAAVHALDLWHEWLAACRVHDVRVRSRARDVWLAAGGRGLWNKIPDERADKAAALGVAREMLAGEAPAALQ